MDITSPKKNQSHDPYYIFSRTRSRPYLNSQSSPDSVSSIRSQETNGPHISFFLDRSAASPTCTEGIRQTALTSISRARRFDMLIAYQPQRSEVSLIQPLSLRLPFLFILITTMAPVFRGNSKKYVFVGRDAANERIFASCIIRSDCWATGKMYYAGEYGQKNFDDIKDSEPEFKAVGVNSHQAGRKRRKIYLKEKVEAGYGGSRTAWSWAPDLG